MLPGDIHEVLATGINRLAQPGPFPFRTPPTLNLLVHRPDLRVNSQRCLHDAVIAHQTDHRQSLIPCFPVQRGWDSQSVGRRIWQMPGQSCELNQDIRRFAQNLRARICLTVTGPLALLGTATQDAPSQHA
jgi:hypothetical protein